MENKNSTNQFKRQYRELSDETKQRISKSMSGVPKKQEHKEKISTGMKNYWHNVPNKPKTTIQDIML